MATISFDLVSPENLIFNDEVGMIIVPGKDGDLGVLPGHSKVMSSLRPGRVMIYGEGKNLLKSFFVSGGFAEVNPDKGIKWITAPSPGPRNTMTNIPITNPGMLYPIRTMRLVTVSYSVSCLIALEIPRIIQIV